MTFAQPFKDYEIQAKVGAGAMGTVFKARHKKLDRIVALKVLRPSLARDERYVDRLRREARIVASLSHRHIVTGYDICEEGGYHFFVMEFVEGPSLRALLSEWGMFPEEQVLKAALQAASALDHAFQRGIIHRDIKPGNILIDERGDLKLTDMGLAKGPTDLTLTRDGATVGTPQYISPEQARNPQDVDIRSDLYSLGATLYHMATGQPPFRGDTMAEVITKVLHEPAVAVHELNPSIGEGMSLVIRKLLAKDLELRYQTPGELIEDLQRVERAEQPQVDRSRLEAADRGHRPSLRRRLLVALLATAVVAAAVWVGFSLQHGAAPDERPAAFLQRIDRELAALPGAAARLAHLQQALDRAPDGCFKPLQERLQLVTSAVQAGVDRSVQALRQQQWAAIQQWVEDPTVWPAVADFERERLGPELQANTGFAAEKLPPGVRRQGLEELRRSVVELMQRRDAELIAAAGQYASGELTARSSGLVDAGEFRAASQLWPESMQRWLDGRTRPRLGRLDQATGDKVQAAWESARTTAAAAIEAAERRTILALRQQAKAALDELRQRTDGADAGALLGIVDSQLQALQRTYPPARAFLPADNPWIELEGEFGSLRDGLRARQLIEDVARCDARIDLAWRTVVDGGPADALQVLRGDASDATWQTRVAPHLDAVGAAADVAAAVLRALSRGKQPFPALLRSSPLQPVDLEVREFDGSPGLWLVAGQRRPAFSEFLFASLLTAANKADAEPLAGIDPARATRGQLVLAMASEDLAGIGARLAAAGDAFLEGDVWPRIVAVRAERGTVTADVADGLRFVRENLQRAQASGQVDALASALDAFRQRFAGVQLERGMQLELERAASWLRTERRRQELLGRLQGAAPAGAELQVHAVAGGFGVDIVLPAATLAAVAPAGCRVVDGDLVFAAAPGQEIAPLRFGCGLPASALEVDMELGVVLAGAQDSDRVLLVGCRGHVAWMAVTADDAVYAAWIEGGDPARAEAVLKAKRQALVAALHAGATSKPRPHATPGALQRLQLGVDAAPGGKRQRWQLEFEQQELCTEQGEVDALRDVELMLMAGPGAAVRELRVHALLPE